VTVLTSKLRLHAGPTLRTLLAHSRVVHALSVSELRVATFRRRRIRVGHRWREGATHLVLQRAQLLVERVKDRVPHRRHFTPPSHAVGRDQDLRDSQLADAS